MNINDNNLAEYLFHEGTNYRAFDYLGAHFIGDDKCVFRTWAPNASQVFVTGAFCDCNDKNDSSPSVPIKGPETIRTLSPSAKSI